MLHLFFWPIEKKEDWESPGCGDVDPKTYFQSSYRAEKHVGGLLGDHVAEPDGRHGDEAKVARVKERPVLPEREHGAWPEGES